MKEKAHQKYLLRDGAQVPSVTQIIEGNLGWNKYALIQWARKEALAGRDPNKVRDKAAEIGTVAHYLIECELTGVQPDVSEFPPASVSIAENCVIAYLDWAKVNNVVLVEANKPLVSETYKYGGTFDKICMINGVLSLVDFKTTNDVYPEYKIQIAAYEQLWNENNPDRKIIDRWIVALGKEDGSFSTHKIGSTEKYFEMFKHLLALNELKE